ncbi:MAG: Pyridoxamine 5-phosphate oxidase-related, FMN-binding protein [Acidimicrobiales bacterium]|nr:Pyridoxamine 5-phosphate oxidase-related, FMN-binding protein [Acidimicrobiales bacterium]
MAAVSDPTGTDPDARAPRNGAAPTPRSTVKRQPDRARYDRDAVHAVLDEGLVAHVGIEVDGQPYVLPMVYARDGERLLLHGSVASRLARGLAAGMPVCVTVTLLDGLVMARSAFHHSMNYRSVVVLGTARKVTDPDELAAGFGRLVEHVAPGRSAEVRGPNDVEARQTLLLEVSIAEASVKSRSGGPAEDPIDLERPSWGGVLPVTVSFGPPLADGDTPAGAAPPASLLGYERPPGGSTRS